MSTYFENQFTYKDITFYMGNSPHITEREIHSYHEVLYFTDTEAVFLTEGGHFQLKHGALMIIPKESYHFFRLPKGKRFSRIKISIPDRVIADTPLTHLMGDIKVIESPDRDIQLLLEGLSSVLKDEQGECNSFYAYSLVMHLLARLNLLDDSVKAVTEKSSPASALATYINENLDGKLDVNALAQAVHTSPSHITHTFKKEFGISLHKYIIQKRLSLAKRLISEGKQPSKVYFDVGFKDYSSFYKAYLAFYGYPPSKEKHP